MFVYTCERNLDAMLTCIYVAWASGKGHNNIRLELEPLGQYSLFDEYTHVDADPILADKVSDSVCRKISPSFYSKLMYNYMAYEEDVLDNIYRVMQLGFAYGPNALEMVKYEAVMRHREITCRLGKEINRFQEFTRFNEVREGLLVAHIEPKSRLVLSLGPIFQDRMPSENWMIIDDIGKEAVVHPRNEQFYLRRLSDDEFDQLRSTENCKDEFIEMWKAYFEAIAIKERNNPRCQRNLMPLWSRRHAVEFYK